MELATYLAVGFGGFVGAISRHAVTNLVASRVATLAALPLGTLLVNVLGCFLLGFLNSFLVDTHVRHRAWVNGGMIGAFTTFSTFSLENLHLIENRAYLLALLNILGSCALGLLALLAGKAAYHRILG